MPTATDLVTDLPADFAVFGQANDTTIKNLNPQTTTGALAYRSATSNVNTALPIGSTGQVLTVASGVPAWSTVAASGMTKIVTADFSAAATVSVNNCFTSTYVNYVIVFNSLGNSGGGAMFMQWQTGTNTIVSGANYYYGGKVVTNAAADGVFNASAATKFTLGPNITTNTRCNITINCSNVGNSSQDANMSALGNGGGGSGLATVGGIFDGAATYTGVAFTANGNLTGTYTVYGLAK